MTTITGGRWVAATVVAMTLGFDAGDGAGATSTAPIPKAGKKNKPPPKIRV